VAAASAERDYCRRASIAATANSALAETEVWPASREKSPLTGENRIVVQAM
jgi:hypothetical protein